MLLLWAASGFTDAIGLVRFLTGFFTRLPSTDWPRRKARGITARYKNAERLLRKLDMEPDAKITSTLRFESIESGRKRTGPVA